MYPIIQRTQHDARAFAALTVALLAIAIAFAFAGSAHAAENVTTQLEPGDSNAQVTALQQFLAADDSVYPEGLVTGYYGSLTTAAVQRYQCKEGIVCQGDVATTGYGRVGPSTLAAIETQEGLSAGSGVSLPPTGYPSTGVDTYAPVLSMPTVATTSSSATVHWTTNEPAHSRVMYGTMWPFLFAAAPSASDATFDESSDVVLTGLAPNTRYFYVLESVDASGNLQWGEGHTLTTSY